MICLVKPSIRNLLTSRVAKNRRKKQQHILNAMGSMYASVPFIGAQNASTVQPVVAIERTVFYRERAAGMYSAFPYSLAQVKMKEKALS